MTIEIVFRQTLALWLGNRDEYWTLESDTTGLNVKGNVYLYLKWCKLDLMSSVAFM